MVTTDIRESVTCGKNDKPVQRDLFLEWRGGLNCTLTNKFSQLCDAVHLHALHFLLIPISLAGLGRAKAH